MDAHENEALRIATQIVIATAPAASPIATKKGGELVGEYLEAIYLKVLAIMKK